MRLLLGQDADVAAWVRARVKGLPDFGSCVAMGVVDGDGKPLGGVVFHNYYPEFRSIDVSCAADTARWLSRRLITQIFSYPFGQLDCQRVTALTPRLATSPRRFLETFGFKREGVVRKGLGDDDAILYGLLKDEWLRSKWNLRGQEVSTNAAARPQPRRHRRGPGAGERSVGAAAVVT